MNKSDEQFNDPALKAALRRVWGSESATPGLRAQITAAIAADRPAPARSDGSSIWSRPLSPLAIAAAALFALLGAGIWIYYGAFAPDQNAGRPAPFTLSNDLVAAMIAVHDQSSTKPATAMLISATNDYSSLRRTLLTKLRRPVWVSDLSKAGWQFQGAMITNIAGNQAAELIFTKEDQTLSLLSLPSPPSCDSYTQDYELASQNHDVVGFAVGGNLFCIVESSRNVSLSLDAVKKIRDDFRQDAMTALNTDAAPASRPN